MVGTSPHLGCQGEGKLLRCCGDVGEVLWNVSFGLGAFVRQ